MQVQGEVTEGEAPAPAVSLVPVARKALLQRGKGSLPLPIDLWILLAWVTFRPQRVTVSKWRKACAKLVRRPVEPKAAQANTPWRVFLGMEAIRDNSGVTLGVPGLSQPNHQRSESFQQRTQPAVRFQLHRTHCAALGK